MWSLLSSNRKCQEHERFYQHKGHLERIVKIKPCISTKEPNKPGFLFRKVKKEQEEEEKLIKIQYENGLIVKKIIDLETHFNQYHPKKIKIKECPAFDKTNHKNFHQKFINKENFKFSQRLIYAKPTYSTKSCIEEYSNNKYIENLIVKNSKNVNPNMNFDTPFNFRKKLENFCLEKNISKSHTAGFINTSADPSKFKNPVHSDNMQKQTKSLRPISAIGKKLNVNLQELPKIKE